MQTRLLLMCMAGICCLAFCTIPAAAEPTGTITITSEPTGAEVYITNVFRGYTPLTVPELRAGMNRIQLKRANYQNWRGVAFIIAGETVTLDIELARTGTTHHGNGNIAISSLPGATVFQNLNYLGTTDEQGAFSIARTDPGLHLISLEKDGYIPYSRLVSVESGRTSGVAADLSPEYQPTAATPSATPEPAAPIPTPPERSPVSPVPVIIGLLLAAGCMLLIRRT